MITVIQQKDKHGWCYCLTKTDGEPIDHAYVIGFSRPNYPMPAIRRKHTWFVDNNGLCHAVAIGKRWFPRQD